MDPQYLQTLNACLEQISAPTGGTEGIKNATKALNENFYKSPQAIPGLFEILCTSSNQSVRQLAAVELRKRVPAGRFKHWKRLDVSTRNAIKARLLELVSNEQAVMTRHSISRVIAEVAEVELENKAWPELLQFLYNSSNSPSAAQREMSVFTLFTLMGTIVEQFAEHLPQIYDLFTKSLSDPESLEVRVTTVQALGRVAEYIDNDEESSIVRRVFKSELNFLSIDAKLVYRVGSSKWSPTIITIIGQTINANDDAAAKKGFDTLENLILLEVPVLNPHLAALIEFLLTVGNRKDVDEELRIMALNSLLWALKFKKGKIGNMGLAAPIVSALIQIGSEDEPEDQDDNSVARTAFQCLDALATSLAPKIVFPPLYEQIRQASASPDAGLRKSSIMALGVTVEGCSLFIEPHMDEVWPFVDAGLQDPDVRVRKAACMAIGCISEYLGEDCARRHAALIPAVTNLLNDPKTQRNALTGLDSLLEVLDNKVIGLYLHPLMERLLPMLDSADLDVKGTIVGAVGSAAYAAKSAFVPYFEETMKRVTPFLATKEKDDEAELRGVTQDCLGTLAQAVGKDVFRPYLEASLTVAFEAITLDSPQLRECSMIFFGVLAKVYNQEFTACLPRVMPAVLASLGQSDFADGEENDAESKSALAKGFSIDDNEEAEDDDAFVDVDIDSDEEGLGITTAIALEKAVAADALLELFDNTKEAFLPYLEKSIEALTRQLDHFYPGTRKAAATTLLGFISTLHEMSNPPKLVPGLANITISDEVKKLVGMVLPEVMKVWTDEDEMEVVSEICSAFSECLGSVGAGVIAPDYLDELCTYVLQILERKARCQQDTDVEDEPTPLGELSEAESSLIGCAADLMGTIATILAGDFAQAFGPFLPAISKYCGTSYSPSDRANTVGAFAEIINGLGGAVGKFTEPLLQIGLTALVDADIEVQSNAAFLVGSLVYWSELDLTSQYMTILGGLQPLFTLREGPMLEKSETARDNAAGAIARLLLKNKAALPLEQVLPVFFNALPLRRDFAEYPKCLDATYQLVQESNPIAQQSLDHLLDVYAHVLRPVEDEDDKPLSDETRSQLIAFVQMLNGQIPDKIAAKGLGAYL